MSDFDETQTRKFDLENRLSSEVTFINVKALMRTSSLTGKTTMIIRHVQ